MGEGRQDAPVADEISPGGGGAAHAEDARRKAVGKVSKVGKSNATWVDKAQSREHRGKLLGGERRWRGDGEAGAENAYS